MAVIFAWKEKYETPLECLTRTIALHPEYTGLSATYAGRLDPLAEGVLPLLFGDSVHEKETYTSQLKTYEIDVLFGVGTDTRDVLGIPFFEGGIHIPVIDKKTIEKIIPSFVGDIEQSYPLFSSKPVDGIPLHKYGRKGIVVTPPMHTVHIESILLQKITTMYREILLEEVKSATEKVLGDFRQEAIQKAWEGIVDRLPEIFQVVSLTVVCGSGTYMRELAHDIGKKLGISALAYKIVRTKVGENIQDSLN